MNREFLYWFQLFSFLFLLVLFKPYKQLEYGYRLDRHAFNILSTSGRNFCQKQCAYRTKCMSFNYNRNQLECQLNSENKTTEVSFIQNSEFAYGDKSNLIDTIKGACKLKVCPINTMCVEIKRGIAHCLLTECEEPPTLANAVILNTIRAVTKNVTYTCNEGYAPVGSAVITCRASGKWTLPQFQCIDCGSPPELSHGSFSAPTLTIGSKATYTCNVGYYMSGTGYITCQSGAVWSSVGFQCIIVDCGSPVSVSNAYVNVQQTIYQSTATYSCNSGYDMNGSNQVSCQANGAWTAVGFQCLPKDCGSPPSLSNGYASYSGTTFGNTATYHCNSGYTVHDSSSISCQASGSWSTTSAYCGCGSLPSVDNTVVSSGTYQIGSSRTFSCYKENHACVSLFSGYTQCQSSGSWSSVTLTCACVYNIFGK